MTKGKFKEAQYIPQEKIPRHLIQTSQHEAALRTPPVDFYERLLEVK
jgi:hypothetical protein